MNTTEKLYQQLYHEYGDDVKKVNKIFKANMRSKSKQFIYKSKRYNERARAKKRESLHRSKLKNKRISVNSKKSYQSLDEYHKYSLHI